MPKHIYLLKLALFVHQVDVCDNKQISELQKNIENDLGFVDILVNNAGILPTISILDDSDEDIDRMVKVNLTSHYYVCEVS